MKRRRKKNCRKIKIALGMSRTKRSTFQSSQYRYFFYSIIQFVERMKIHWRAGCKKFWMKGIHLCEKFSKLFCLVFCFSFLYADQRKRAQERWWKSGFRARRFFVVGRKKKNDKSMCTSGIAVVSHRRACFAAEAARSTSPEEDGKPSANRAPMPSKRD